MELEAITRQEQIIAGKDLQPVTRMEFFLKAYGGGSSGGGAQPDWNQNDSTATDYVKNRPFYTGDPVETMLVEESTVSFANSGGSYVAEFPTSFNAEFGKTYKVSWDGTVYECVCENFNNGIPTIGNQSIIGVGADTGEAFIIFNESGQNETGWASMTADASDSHTISISGFGAPEVVKIDEKYIPAIPADKLPAIPVPVIEFTTIISENIANDAQPSFSVSNLSYSEIYSLVEKGNFQIKDSGGYNYRPIQCNINTSGNIFVCILVPGSPTNYAQLVCNADQTVFYRNFLWQIEATQK